ncbi:MAG: zeta toxin family protein, partial [Terriglobales bacterium]
TRGIEADFDRKYGVVVVNNDTLREFYPNYKELLKRGDPSATGYARPDGPIWVAKALAYARERGYNVILDGTMSGPTSTLRVAAEFRDAGYRVHGEIVAGPRHRSRRQVLKRYLEQCEEIGFGRYVSERKHDQTYAGVLDTADAVERSGLFHRIRVRDSSGEVLYLNELADSGDMVRPPGGARAAILKARACRPSGRAVTEHVRFLKQAAKSLEGGPWARELTGIAHSLPFSGPVPVGAPRLESDICPMLEEAAARSVRTLRLVAGAELGTDSVENDFHSAYRRLDWRPMGERPIDPSGEVSYQDMKKFLIGSSYPMAVLGSRQISSSLRRAS